MASYAGTRTWRRIRVVNAPGQVEFVFSFPLTAACTGIDNMHTRFIIGSPFERESEMHFLY